MHMKKIDFCSALRTVLVLISLLNFLLAPHFAQARRVTGDTEDNGNGLAVETTLGQSGYPAAGNPVRGTYHPNRRSSSSDGEDYRHSPAYENPRSPFDSRRTTTVYSSNRQNDGYFSSSSRSQTNVNSRSRYNDDYGDTSYIPASTKKPSRSSGGIFQSIKDLLSHSSVSSGTSSPKHRPSSGYDDFSGRSVDERNNEEGKSKSGLGDAFSKYGKYLVPALTMAGKHLPKLLGKKFGGSDKEVANTRNSEAVSDHSETYSPSVNRNGAAEWNNGKRTVPIGTPIRTTNAPDENDYYASTKTWKIFTPRRPRTENNAFTSTAMSTEENTDVGLRKEEVCNLVRWNRELPFTELPSMVVIFLANDSASGRTNEAKAQALRGLLERTAETFNSEEVLDAEQAFAVPAGVTWRSCFGQLNRHSEPASSSNPLSTRCLMAQRLKTNWPECVTTTTATSVAVPVKEALVVGLDRLRAIYLSNSEDGQQDFDDLVQAAVACSNTKEDKSVRSRLANCLDYSLHSEQVINTNVSGSVFGNEEICSRFLTFDIARCAGLIPRNAPQVHKPSACRADQLLIIGAFARNFYSCQNEIDSRMVVGLQRVNSKQ